METTSYTPRVTRIRSDVQQMPARGHVLHEAPQGEHVTLLYSGPAELATWRTIAQSNPRVTMVDEYRNLPAKIAALAGALDRVVIAGPVPSSFVLQLIASLPPRFQGDVVLIQQDASFVATVRDGSRHYTAMRGDELRIYLAAHGLSRADEAKTPRVPNDAGRQPLGVLLPPLCDSGEMKCALVADDDRKSRELGAEVLRARGYGVVLAASGIEAIRMADTFRPALIMLDGLMPEMHGFEVSRFVRHLSSGYRPAILMMTAIYKSSRYQNDARLKYGIDAYLVKPLDLDALGAALERCEAASPSALSATA